MSDRTHHRKLVQHFDQPGHAHELTFSCYQRMALLCNDKWNKLLSQSIDRAISKQGFRLIAFVYMPEHVHLLVFPCREEAKIERLLYAIKRPFSFRVKQDLQRSGSPLLTRLTVRERPGKSVFRFWQEGGGYDRNFMSPERMIASAEYIHRNPVRRQLCCSPDQWKWSSWRHYHLPESDT